MTLPEWRTTRPRASLRSCRGRCVRGECETYLVGHGRVVRVGHVGGSDGGVDPDATLALIEEDIVFVGAVRRGAGRASILHEIDVEGERVLPLTLVELRPPLLIEPASAKRVRQGGEEGHVLAPTGLAAEADAIDLVCLVGNLPGGVGDKIPCRGIRHAETSFVEEILAVHRHRTLAIEGRGIELAVIGEAGTNRGKQIADLIVASQLVECH